MCIYFIDEPWLEVYHNSDDFEEQFANRLINSIEICNIPFEVTSCIVKILDYD